MMYSITGNEVSLSASSHHSPYHEEIGLCPIRVAVALRNYALVSNCVEHESDRPAKHRLALTAKADGDDISCFHPSELVHPNHSRAWSRYQRFHDSILSPRLLLKMMPVWGE